MKRIRLNLPNARKLQKIVHEHALAIPSDKGILPDPVA
jgi:hypothetical protein